MSEPSGPPAHTCDRVTASPQCPGCQHQSSRFPDLLFGFLDLVTNQDPTDENAESYHEIIDELRRIGMLSALWYHLACTATQLAAAPVRIDREKSWEKLMRLNPVLGVPVLDLCDELLTAAATDDRNRALLVTRELAPMAPEAHNIVHLSLSELVEEHAATTMSVWQNLAYRCIMHDAWASIGHPHEALMAARICGALLDGNHDLFYQLMNRATMSGMVHKLVMLWARGTSTHLGEGAQYAIVRMRGDNFDAMLNPDADLADCETPQERGFLVAERMIRAMAQDDPALGATVPEALEAEPELLRHMIMSLANFYAQTLHALYGQTMREHLAQCGGSTEPGAPASA